jgi:hypothetical protein
MSSARTISAAKLVGFVAYLVRLPTGCGCIIKIQRCWLNACAVRAWVSNRASMWRFLLGLRRPGGLARQEWKGVDGRAFPPALLGT